MRDANGSRSDPMVLQLSYKEPPFTPRCLVYTGKFSWRNYAIDEMLTVIVPATFNGGDPICVYWQWMEDADGRKKINRDRVGTLDVTAGPFTGDAQTLGIPVTFYRFDGEVDRTRDRITLTMSGHHDEKSEHITLQLANDLLQKKKALIIRYDVGVDEGIHRVRDMLVDTLGFGISNVEMLYYDAEPKDRPRLTKRGQEAPTAEQFKSKFTALLKDTKPGDIRFLYVDAHGVPLYGNDENERGRDESWKFAETEDGQNAELVHDDWIADTVQQNLHQSANLTMLCTACFGGGMLDLRRRSSGILLSACFDTQINVKAVKVGDVRDPWTLAILDYIDKREKKKKRMASYNMLFAEARLRVRSMMDSGLLTSSYLGPSPDPRNPIAWQEGRPMQGHQDPQLVFNGWYVDVNTARFLEPFQPALSRPQDAGRNRYPRDEL
ncbi:hypothetical protein SCP_0306090 [Sparassis crispa]|uniref:Uncharacterized protein n=1 Tax=Sparassis crispa TaxID=139825 RepID=A0A401GFF4_9APHY|nr:hypothetical protein SCP_0306090 [Sparassis crispa]GBE80889.1 hypothetical protein SCP_0306090 [Sparassis crispa]